MNIYDKTQESNIDFKIEKNNAAVSANDEPWEVCYNGGFFGKQNPSKRMPEELALNACFAWNSELWHIPAVYIFPKGIVVDFCVEIDPEREKAFIEKWIPTKISEERLTRELRRQIDNENPLNIEFCPYLTVNGRLLTRQNGMSVSWIPISCLPDDEQNDRQAVRIIKHYGLDATKAWSFHRISFLWATVKKPKIRSMSLKSERELVQIDGICFKNPSVGDVITFTHPVFGTEHKLTVLEYEPQELPSHAFANPEYEFPTYHIAMTYTLDPDIPNKNFGVRDRLDNDEPKRRPQNAYEPQATYDACTIGIIGGADGPTAVILSAGKNTNSVSHTALSALHFEPTNDVEWKMIFKEKQCEDIVVKLL